MAPEEPHVPDAGDRPIFDGKALAKARRSRGLTQLELAALVGYDGDATISKIEKGVRQPSPGKWVELAEALDVEPDALAAPAGTHPRRVAPRDILPKRSSSEGSSFSRHVAILDAARQAKENQDRVDAINKGVQRLERGTRKRLDSWAQTKSQLDDELLHPFFDLTGRIVGIVSEDLQGLDLTEATPLTPQRRLEIQRDDLQRGIVDIAGTTAASAGLAAVAGAGAAYAAFSATAALAAASTGAAISGLSGAAATSATLAALGGGSLAAGGLGVAGGVAVLSAVITAPVLLVAGVAFVYKGRQMQARTRSQAAAIADAEKELRKSIKRLTQIWAWIDQADQLLKVAAAVGEDEISWLRGLVERAAVNAEPSAPASESPTLAWDSLSEREQSRYVELTGLIATAVNLLTAPFLAILDDDIPRNEVKAISEWNELVIADSALRLRVAVD